MSFISDYKNRKCKTLVGDFIQTLIFNDAFKGLVGIGYVMVFAVFLAIFEAFNLVDMNNTIRLIIVSPALFLLTFLILKWIGYLFYMLFRFIGNTIAKIKFIKKWLSK